MNIKHFVTIVGLAALGIAFSAQAHDPEEHMKDAEQPHCATLKTMDQSTMDGNDPVQQAMMKQCMQDMHKTEPEMDEVHTDSQDKGERPEEQRSAHPH